MCDNGNDVRMNPYIVVGTGDEVGMVEVVPNSDTVARCQWAGGGGTCDKKSLRFYSSQCIRASQSSVCESKVCGGRC